MSLFVSLKNYNQSKNLETIDVSGLSQYSYIGHWLIKMKSAVFTAMLPGELASSAGNYDGIQTANFMYNAVIINVDNALNPSAKMRIIYTTIQKNTAIFQLRKFKTNLGRGQN
jgi:hypothetical protein